ncbi:methyltransferase domain-containing protein [Aldersonia sp. NBC_00410]|uniref:class I SAM-dependent methyltransferase n=1 Tax=Aldersonia sp. NBC_00410 TaxID=2975954 RepID=UPI0022515944|nr:class I SAM-dependent methyltransferase [Aldersonia sp. NBC_00410]MCX5044865.1 methyltransferase domain-containing protein [Aldersonia sp. NBC_00410]
MAEEFDKEFWEQRYTGDQSMNPDRQPNPYLLSAARDLVVGSALDAGCGEGAEAIWLAEHGWTVTALDLAEGALQRARQRAAAHGSGITSRIEWRQVDLTGWKPADERFDLVCSNYVHPTGSHEEMVRRLAAAVAPGGTLLVVDHLRTDGHGHGHGHGHGTHTRSDEPMVTRAVDDLSAGIDTDEWEIVVAQEHTRIVAASDGEEKMLHDAVLVARRRS